MKTRAFVLAFGVLAAAPAIAADNYVVKDGAGTSRTIRAKDVSGVLVPMSIPSDATGTAYSSSSGLPVAQQGAWTFGLTGAVPAGTNAIGTVGITGTVPLPTGAATAAKQPALGTAGTASADVLSVQGIASGTPLRVDGSAATQPVSASALPLPSGASTAALQTTGNGSLASIATAVAAATPAGENHVGQVGGHAAVATASFTRPANTTAYAAGQLVANSTTAGSVTAMQIAVARITGGSGVIRRARLTTSATTLANASFDLLIYRPSSGGACPISAAGDGATYSTDGALNYLGRIPITLDQTFTDGAKGIGVPSVGAEITFDAPAGYTYLCGFLRAAAAYAPASAGAFTAAVEAQQN